MIHHLTGTITSIGAQSIVIDVHGCGIEVFVSSPQMHVLDHSTHLHTTLHWNQETGPQVFGFMTSAERSLFLLLTGCQGIGPKLALVFLHHIPLSQFVEALQQGNADKLSSIKGLGPKKAEMLIIHARSKRDALSSLIQQLPTTLASQRSSAFDDVYQALQTLKYTPSEITSTLQSLHHEAALAHAPFEVIMRRALFLMTRPAV